MHEVSAVGTTTLFPGRACRGKAVHAANAATPRAPQRQTSPHWGRTTSITSPRTNVKFLLVGRHAEVDSCPTSRPGIPLAALQQASTPAGRSCRQRGDLCGVLRVSRGSKSPSTRSRRICCRLAALGVNILPLRAFAADRFEVAASTIGKLERRSLSSWE